MEAELDTSEIVLYFARPLPLEHHLHLYCIMKEERMSCIFETLERVFPESQRTQ